MRAEAIDLYFYGVYSQTDAADTGEEIKEVKLAIAKNVDVKIDTKKSHSSDENSQSLSDDE